MNIDFFKTCSSFFCPPHIWPSSFGFSCTFQSRFIFKALGRVFHSATSSLKSWTGRIVKTPYDIYGSFAHIGARMRAIFNQVHNLPNTSDQHPCLLHTQEAHNLNNSEEVQQRSEISNASQQPQMSDQLRGDELIQFDNRTQMSGQDSSRASFVALREQKSLKIAQKAAQIEMRAEQKLSDAIAREKNVHDQELALQPREQRLVASLRKLDSDQKLVETQKRANQDIKSDLTQQMGEWVQRSKDDSCKLEKERDKLGLLQQKNKSSEQTLRLRSDDLKQRQRLFEQRANELEKMDNNVKRLTERANEVVALRTNILDRIEKELQSLLALQQSRKNEMSYIALVKKKHQEMHAVIVEMTRKSYLDLSGSYQVRLQFLIDRNHRVQDIYMRNLKRIAGSRSVESARAVEPSLLEEFFKMGKEELFSHILQNSMAEKCSISYEHIANDEQVAFFNTNAMTSYSDLNIQHYYQQKPICPTTLKKPIALIYPYRGANRQVYYLVPNAQLQKEQVARLISDYIGRRRERNVQTAREIGELYPQYEEHVEKLIKKITQNGASNETSAFAVMQTEPHH